ncbi:hypothetical protein [Bradyrhizobium mercantei]|uniref:hypothetical protein n=1 Tax=Bradyrhizobium mercantei TaxID=1904807 RepID=UPI0011778381|nr:hypothetical protein [Bradyrhizobium mercantei]
MNEQLLQSFLSEEANDYVRQLLLRRISEFRSGASVGVHKFEFNRFIVTIDCELGEATIEDDLNPGPEGKGSGPLESFISALWQNDRGQPR